MGLVLLLFSVFFRTDFAFLPGSLYSNENNYYFDMPATTKHLSRLSHLIFITPEKTSSPFLEHKLEI